MVALLMMVVVVWKVVRKVVRNLFLEGFRTIVWYFWVSYVLVGGSYVGFYVRGGLWSARGEADDMSGWVRFV